VKRGGSNVIGRKTHGRNSKETRLFGSAPPLHGCCIGPGDRGVDTGRGSRLRR